jgi:hypothetical protein
MAARPHDADQSGDHTPDEDVPGVDDSDSPDAPEPRPAGGEPTPAEVEQRWRELVSQLGEPAGTVGPADVGRPEPDAGEPIGRRAGDGDVPAPDDRRRVVRPAVPEDPRGWAPDPDVEEADDHFEPPEPGPVLAGDPLLTMAWVAVLGMPLLLVVTVVAWRDIPTALLTAAGAAFLAGIGLLLWRMPAGRDDDRGPGAVV